MGFTRRPKELYVKKVTYFGEFDYPNSLSITKIIILMFLSSSRDKFYVFVAKLSADVSVGFRHVGVRFDHQPLFGKDHTREMGGNRAYICWCPPGWAPVWRLHTNLFKFG